MKKLMKLRFMWLIALFIAIGTMSFRAIDLKPTFEKEQQLHWYIKDAVTGVWEEDVQGENPSINCPGGTLNLCAKGFETPPMEPVDDLTPADQTRTYGP